MICAEPAALSVYLFEWERTQKPKASCDPEKDPNWQESLKIALGEIKPNNTIPYQPEWHGYDICILPQLFADDPMPVRTRRLESACQSHHPGARSRRPHADQGANLTSVFDLGPEPKPRHQPRSKRWLRRADPRCVAA